MNLISLKQMSLKFILNYRIILAYLMALSYLCMHYFVTNSQYIIKNGANDSFKVKVVNNQNSNIMTSNYLQKSKNLYKRNFLIYSSSWLSSKNQVLKSKQTSSNSILLSRLLIPKQLIKIDEPNTKGNYFNLRNKSSIYYSQIMQDKILTHLLNSTELNNQNASFDGTYVEAGAFDGETWSNTLHLEKYKNWRGLLIEPSIENYKILLSKNRKNSYSINSCLGPVGSKSVNSTYIEAGPFGITSFTASSSKSTGNSQSDSIYSITCHPLAKILDEFFEKYPDMKLKKSKISNQNNSSQQTTIIDYLSMDIEGSEKSTIETFPWHLYQFNLINIEFNQNKELYKWIREFMKKYDYIETIIDDVWYQDVYLAHKSILNKLNLDILNVSKFVKLFNN